MDSESKRDNNTRNKRPFETSQESSDSTSDSDQSEESSDESNPLSWIEWHCSEKANKFLCEVEKDYIRDSFNLCGLAHLPHYRRALDRILDLEDEWEDEEEEVSVKKVNGGPYVNGIRGTRKGSGNQAGRDVSEGESEDSEARSWRLDNEIDDTAEKLYGLIHERYIRTAPGLNAMLQKYMDKEFGICPRVACDNQAVLPSGLSNFPEEENVKTYCPRCKEVYTPCGAVQSMDGAYIGTTFPYLFLMQYPVSVQKRLPSKPPTIYGYRIHKSSPFWRGDPPEDTQELKTNGNVK